MARRKKKATSHGQRGVGYPTHLKIRVAQEVVDKGRTITEVAKTLGLSATTVKEWAWRYELRGAEGLDPPRGTPTKEPTGDREQDPLRSAVENAKREQPDAGTRKI